MSESGSNVTHASPRQVCAVTERHHFLTSLMRHFRKQLWRTSIGAYLIMQRTTSGIGTEFKPDACRVPEHHRDPPVHVQIGGCDVHFFRRWAASANRVGTSRSLVLVGGECHSSRVVHRLTLCSHSWPFVGRSISTPMGSRRVRFL